MISGVRVLRYTAFSNQASGGNPAGVVLDATGLDEETMLAVAASVGYSETAFLWRLHGANRFRVRYFSPVAEVPFCGHATIAAALALADSGVLGQITFATNSGEVAVDVDTGGTDGPTASLTSVTPWVHEVADDLVDEALASFGWDRSALDPALPPRVAFAGAQHLVIALSSRDVLAAMAYDFERLRALMTAHDWTTVQVVWRESDSLFHARVAFAVGGVVEDPATGAGAAALGAYLRELGAVSPPARLTIRQGDDLGRPSRLVVDVPPGDAGIRVSGTGVRLPSAA